jgi:hypothetical protein
MSEVKFPLSRADAAIYSAVLIAATTLTIAAYGWTGKSLGWIFVLFALLLLIENLPEAPGRWNRIKLAGVAGVLAGWAVVFYLLWG